MKTADKIIRIISQCIPILLMIILILFVKNDYYLLGVFVLIIIIAFLFKREKKIVFISYLG